jgi:large subunit ribosomal protein L9
MDVILLEDLQGVGQKGATVSVKPGFARNYLLPRRLAISAGTNAGNLYQEMQRQREVQSHKQILAAQAEAARIDGVEINVPGQANEEDTLFGSVTSTDIADALEKAGHKIDKRAIQLDEHIKQLGKYDVPVKFFGGVTATLKVWVVRA